MALSIEQIAAVSYPAVLAEMRKPENQWAESAALRELERQGAIQRVSLGETIQIPLDYRRNPDVAVLASDQDAHALVKTEVLTAASYDIAQISIPVTWTKGDDAKNPTENQKVALVKSLLENGIQSHDDKMEELIFETSAEGGDEFNGLDSLVPNDGQGSPGGISAATETWWQNFSDVYFDALDIEAAMTEAYNEALKGSGSALGPKFLLSGSDPHALYESVLQALQRFQDVNDGNAGFKTLAFKTCRYVFSPFGDDRIYFLNPKSYKIVMSKQYFRDKSNTVELPEQNTFTFKIYSAGQAVVSNKSRLAVLRLGS